MHGMKDDPLRALLVGHRRSTVSESARRRIGYRRAVEPPKSEPRSPILNLDEVQFEHVAHGERFEVRDGPISHVIGGKQLGYSLAVVPPGKRAYPFHCHHVNEEMFFVLEGTG